MLTLLIEVNNDKFSIKAMPYNINRKYIIQNRMRASKFEVFTQVECTNVHR